MTDELIYPYHAKVVAVRDMAAMMDMLKSKMHDPAMLDNMTPFFWSAEISNGNVDSYFTHMLPSTLTNFANDATAGVSFLNSHRHNELPLGRSLRGVYEADRVVADFYTMPGLNLNGVTTDDFITGVKTGLLSDVSVGFSLGQGQMWCDVCKMDYRSWDCPHVAGMKYDIQGGGQVVATVGVDNARLAEVSAVFDGATPDATILKATRMIEAGELKPDAVRMLEARYRMSFATKRSFPGVDLGERKSKAMDLEKIFNQLREVLTLAADGDVLATVAALKAERDRLTSQNEVATQEADALRTKLAELEPQAKDGAQYRTDLIAEALGEGVRAYGDKFAKDTYEKLLRSVTLDVIKQMKADWLTLGNERFKGGRQTVDNSQAPEAKNERKTGVPDTAFKTK